MSGDTIGLLLGSSVLAAGAGAYLQSGRQREERFRDRMITEAIDFLKIAFGIEKSLIDVENAAWDAGRGSGKGLAAHDQMVRDAVDAAWDRIPILAIVFPDRRVAHRARALIEALEGWQRRLVEFDQDNEAEAHLRAAHDEIGRAKDDYTGVAQRAIRGSAFRSFRLAYQRNGD